MLYISTNLQTLNKRFDVNLATLRYFKFTYHIVIDEFYALCLSQIQDLTIINKKINGSAIIEKAFDTHYRCFSIECLSRYIIGLISLF